MFIGPVFQNGFQPSANSSLWDLWWDNITLLHCLFSLSASTRNYQTSCYSLKPSCGNCHWTTLQQGSEMTSAGIEGFAGGSMCKASLQCLCCGLSPAMCPCPIVWWLSCSHAGWKHTHHSLTRRPRAKSFSEWGHITTTQQHALIAVHGRCLNELLHLSQTPSRGQ